MAKGRQAKQEVLLRVLLARFVAAMGERDRVPRGSPRWHELDVEIDAIGDEIATALRRRRDERPGGL